MILPYSNLANKYLLCNFLAKAMDIRWQEIYLKAKGSIIQICTCEYSTVKAIFLHWNLFIEGPLPLKGIHDFKFLIPCMVIQIAGDM